MVQGSVERIGDLDLLVSRLYLCCEGVNRNVVKQGRKICRDTF